LLPFFICSPKRATACSRAGIEALLLCL